MNFGLAGWPQELDWLGFDICALLQSSAALRTLLSLTDLFCADGFDQAVTFEGPRHTYEWNLFDRMSTPHQYVIPSALRPAAVAVARAVAHRSCGGLSWRAHIMRTSARALPAVVSV